MSRPHNLETQKHLDWRKWPHNRSHWDGHPQDEVKVLFGFSRREEPNRTYLAHQLNWKGFNDETRFNWVKVIAEGGEE